MSDLPPVEIQFDTVAARTQRTLLKKRIQDMARAVARRPGHIGVLSTGERCAVALILNKPRLLCPGDTMLYAAQRVGTDWLQLCWEIQRDGWKS